MLLTVAKSTQQRARPSAGQCTSLTACSSSAKPGGPCVFAGQPRSGQYRSASRVGVGSQKGGCTCSSALDAAAVRRWSIAAADALAEHRAEIDALNVFPVPDGDTGTNLALTLRAADDALAAEASADRGRGLRRMARGAAHGRSGQLRLHRLADPARIRRRRR